MTTILLKALDDKDYKLAKEIILNNRADLNATDDCGQTALIHCSSIGWENRNIQHDLMTLLLDRGANPNIIDNKYHSNALLYILEVNRPEITKRLISCTDLFVRDSDNMSALAMAIKFSHVYAIDLICETAKNLEDIEKFKQQLIRPLHEFTPYAEEVLGKIEFKLKLQNSLSNELPSSLTNKKQKI